MFCEPSSAASLAGRRQGGPRRRARPRRDRRVRADGQRPQGPGHRRGRRDGRGGRGGRRASPTSAGRSAGGEPVRRPAAVPGRPSSGAGSPSRSRPRRPTSARATTASGWRSTSSTASSRRGPCDWATGSIELEVEGEGAFELPATAVEPVRARASRRRSRRRSGRGPAGDRLADRDGQRHPALARPRLVGRGDRRRRGRRRRARRARRRDATRRRGAAPARVDHRVATPTTRRPCCWAGSSSRRSSPIASRRSASTPRAGLRCVLYVPDRRLATEDMRGVLPEQVPLAARRREPGPRRRRRRGHRHRPVRAARRPHRRPPPRALSLGAPTRSCRA